MLIPGKCHCGNIALELDWKGDSSGIPARACGCSFCVKHGCVWTSNPNSKLVVAIRNPLLVSTYAFGTRTAAFHVCRERNWIADVRIVEGAPSNRAHDP